MFARALAGSAAFVWGGAHLGLKPNHDPMNGITRLTLHHTSEHPGMRGLNDREVIAKIAKYHRDVLGWADIGYHYLIGKDGKIYQGRSLLAQGAHAGSGNNGHNLVLLWLVISCISGQAVNRQRRWLPSCASRCDCTAFPMT